MSEPIRLQPIEINPDHIRKLGRLEPLTQYGSNKLPEIEKYRKEILEPRQTMRFYVPAAAFLMTFLAAGALTSFLRVELPWRAIVVLGSSTAMGTLMYGLHRWKESEQPVKRASPDGEIELKSVDQFKGGIRAESLQIYGGLNKLEGEKREHAAIGHLDDAIRKLQVALLSGDSNEDVVALYERVHVLKPHCGRSVEATQLDLLIKEKIDKSEALTRRMAINMRLYQIRANYRG